jgi:carbon monoxide dehydrogenase subunit G
MVLKTVLRLIVSSKNGQKFGFGRPSTAVDARFPRRYFPCATSLFVWLIMDMNGSFVFNLDRQTVWSALMNPDAIAKALPGVKEMIPIEGEDHAWRAIARLDVSAVSGMFSGQVRLSEIDAPNQYRLTVSGEGQQSIISGTALLKLSDGKTPQQTIVTWKAQAHLSGKLEDAAQRLVKVAAGVLGKQFFRGLARQLGDTSAETLPEVTKS